MRQLKIDLKDMHSRLKRSEQIKDSSLQELERLECENELITEENHDFRQKLENQEITI